MKEQILQAILKFLVGEPHQECSVMVDGKEIMLIFSQSNNAIIVEAFPPDGNNLKFTLQALDYDGIY